MHSGTQPSLRDLEALSQKLKDNIEKAESLSDGKAQELTTLKSALSQIEQLIEERSQV